MVLEGMHITRYFCQDLMQRFCTTGFMLGMTICYDYVKLYLMICKTERITVKSFILLSFITCDSHFEIVWLKVYQLLMYNILPLHSESLNTNLLSLCNYYLFICLPKHIIILLERFRQKHTQSGSTWSVCLWLIYYCTSLVKYY